MQFRVLLCVADFNLQTRSIDWFILRISAFTILAKRCSFLPCKCTYKVFQACAMLDQISFSVGNLVIPFVFILNCKWLFQMCDRFCIIYDSVAGILLMYILKCLIFTLNLLYLLPRCCLDVCPGPKLGLPGLRLRGRGWA